LRWRAKTLISQPSENQDATGAGITVVAEAGKAAPEQHPVN
jgi:hypothetical protein